MKNFFDYLGIIAFIIGIVIMVLNFKYAKVALTSPIDIYEDGITNSEDIKSGMAIESEMNILMECFGSMETTTTNRRSGSSSTHNDYYYIMPIFVEDETYYVAYKVREDSEDFSTYKKISKETMAFLNGSSDNLSSTTIEINGGLHKLDEKVYGYMTDWFESSNWFESDKDIDKYVLPLVFEPQDDAVILKLLWVSVGLIVGGLAIMIIIAVIDKKNKRKAEAAC